MEQFLFQNQWIILLAVLWTIFWKGIALRKSARNNHKAWFIIFLLINTLAILEIFYIFIFNRPRPAKLGG